MKIKAEHVTQLTDALRLELEDPTTELGQCLALFGGYGGWFNYYAANTEIPYNYVRRGLWGIFYKMSYERRQAWCNVIYTYADDSHIETVLKQVVKDLGFIFNPDDLKSRLSK